MNNTTVMHGQPADRKPHPPRKRQNRSVRTIFGLAIFLGLATVSGGATALFSDVSFRGANGFSTSSLAAPTALAAAVAGADVTLTWNASTSGIATATEIYRSSTAGGAYTLLATVTPPTTTSFVDPVTASGTYFYVVRATYQSWFSANSTEVSATVTLSLATPFSPCTSQLNDTGGDGSGYNNVSPANACADDGLFATDKKSGNSTSTLCTNTGKDRHRFWNFGLTVPTTATVLGVEVQVKLGTNNNAGITLVCSQLSWDGGVTWAPLIRSVAIPNTTLTLYTMGGTADTWGRTWSGTDFSNANFRVRLIDVSDSTNKDFLLDYVKVRVTYTP
jgi:hypothetical protein